MNSGEIDFEWDVRLQTAVYLIMVFNLHRFFLANLAHSKAMCLSNCASQSHSMANKQISIIVRRLWDIDAAHYHVIHPFIGCRHRRLHIFTPFRQIRDLVESRIDVERLLKRRSLAWFTCQLFVGRLATQSVHMVQWLLANREISQVSLTLYFTHRIHSYMCSHLFIESSHICTRMQYMYIGRLYDVRVWFECGDSSRPPTPTRRYLMPTFFPSKTIKCTIHKYT